MEGPGDVGFLEDPGGGSVSFMEGPGDVGFLEDPGGGSVSFMEGPGDVGFMEDPRGTLPSSGVHGGRSFVEDPGGRYLRRGSRDASFTESAGCSACHSPVAHSSAVLSAVLIHVTFR